MFEKRVVQVGDRFMKSATYATDIWVVGRIFAVPAEPPHAHLEKEGSPLESITVSVPALADPQYFRKV